MLAMQIKSMVWCPALLDTNVLTDVITLQVIPDLSEEQYYKCTGEARLVRNDVHTKLHTQRCLVSGWTIVHCNTMV